MLVPAITDVFYWCNYKSLPLTMKDAILIGRFGNKTGDAMFDETLRQGFLLSTRTVAVSKCAFGSSCLWGFEYPV